MVRTGIPTSSSISGRDARGLAAACFSATFPPCAPDVLRNRRKKAKRPLGEEVKTQKMLKGPCCPVHAAETSHPAVRKIRREKDIANLYACIRSGNVWLLRLSLRGFFACDGICRLVMLCMFFGIRLTGSMPPIHRVRVG